MKDRLKKKLKAKKILGNNPRHAKPVKKKEYPMPPEYNEYLVKLTEMIEQQDELKRILPTLSPEKRAEALPHVREFGKAIENFEQKMAEEYDNFQARSRRIDEQKKEKDDSFARLYEHLQRGFIVMKHKLPAETFKKFEDTWVGKMSEEDRKEFYELVAHRESYDLENILADPDGRVRRPMKHPQIQMNEAIFEIDRAAYETPEDFKEMEAIYEQTLASREKADSGLWLLDPEHRPAKRKKIEELDRMIDEALPQLIQYLASCFAETGKKERKHPDRKKLDAAFAQAGVAQERMYLMYKHTRPELLEDFTKVCLSAYTKPEEIEAFHARVAKRETEELDEILASVGVEKDKE
jgi:hypothetical protein